MKLKLVQLTENRKMRTFREWRKICKITICECFLWNWNLIFLYDDIAAWTCLFVAHFWHLQVLSPKLAWWYTAFVGVGLCIIWGRGEPSLAHLLCSRWACEWDWVYDELLHLYAMLRLAKMHISVCYQLFYISRLVLSEHYHVIIIIVIVMQSSG